MSAPTRSTPTNTVLLSGDWHGNYGHASWTVDQATRLKTDRIFQVGDFGYWEHEPLGVAFLDKLDRHATDAGVTVHFLDGNHDKTSLLLSRYTERDDDGFILVRPNVRYAPRGHRWTWDAVRFVALGGAYSVDKGYRLRLEDSRDRPETLWFPEEQMSDEDLAAILADTDPVDVLLCHDKPLDSNPTINRKELRECRPNQERIQRAVETLRPSLLAHGHLHYRYTDRVRVDDDTWCAVEGLDADPESALGKRDGSYLLLSLAEVPNRPV